MRRASICSVTRMVPISAAIAAPTRPATINPVNTGPNSVTNPFQYEGGYFESSTGLVKFGTRYYNPQLGRWTQQDLVAGSLGNPDSLNRYLYAGDDPVNMTDPRGKQGGLYSCVTNCLGAICTIPSFVLILVAVACAFICGVSFGTACFVCLFIIVAVVGFALCSCLGSCTA